MKDKRYRRNIGDVRVSPNGYHYTYTMDGWKLTHRLVMEKHLNRKLAKDERVSFKDRNRKNIVLDNLILKQVKSKEHRIAYLDATIARLKAERDDLAS